MLIHKRGNLLDLAEAGEFDVVVQGCNCFNTMGGGIAREIRERYPQVALVDQETDRGDYQKLGTWTDNMSTGEDVFEYTAFQLILQKLAHEYPGKRFGFPYIGMGLAGGDKAKIIPMIEKFAKQVSIKGGSVTLVEFGS